MEIDYVNKNQLLKPIIFKSENIISKNDLQITLDNTRNIVSLNQNREDPKKFKTLFKKYFLFEPPKISELHINKKYIVFWVRTNSFFIIGEFNLKDLKSVFSSTAFMTDQTGGWISIQIEGKASKKIFEKLITLNLDQFIKGKVIRTSINKVNCFVLCENQFYKYTIICPISYHENLQKRLCMRFQIFLNKKNYWVFFYVKKI